MANIVIDGRSFSGSRIQITGEGRVLIDGAAQEGTLHGRVEIHVIEGVIEHLEVEGDVHCGTVSGNVDAGGSVTCGNVGGYVDAGGSVTCGTVGGYVDAGSSVTAGDVHGYIDAGGPVTIARNST
jgi:hypothetical protein